MLPKSANCVQNLEETLVYLLYEVIYDILKLHFANECNRR